MGPEFGLCLNTDNNLATGFQLIPFPSHGLEYVLRGTSEGLSVLKVPSTPVILGWEVINNSSINISKTSTVLEIKIPKSMMSNLGATINVECFDMKASGLVSQLPEGGGGVPYRVFSTKPTAASNVTSLKV